MEEDQTGAQKPKRRRKEGAGLDVDSALYSQKRGLNLAVQLE